jgi:hypothetical protein
MINAWRMKLKGNHGLEFFVPTFKLVSLAGV